MNQVDVRGRFRWISVAVMAVWFFGAVTSWGGKDDCAPPKELMEAFPTATRSTMLMSTSRFSSAPRIMEVRDGDVLLGYAVDLKVKSRSGSFRMLVAVSPEEAVIEVQVPNYPHRRGRGVRKQSFLQQFNGVTYGQPLRFGEQVDGVSGATSSSAAVTGGVRQALILIHRQNLGK
jgi:hypothetical protein